MTSCLIKFLKPNKSKSHNISGVSTPSNYSNLDNDKATDLLFIFGQDLAHKSDLLSVLKDDSILQNLIASF